MAAFDPKQTRICRISGLRFSDHASKLPGHPVMERRLSAILAADVAGYTGLMEQDEAGTFERVRSYRKELFEPEIERHHGRIFKLMGDGLLAEFASVVEAVECAVILQRGMVERNSDVPEESRILVRIGINLGDVIVEGEDRHGEGVNIAARLQQMAEPGGISVSQTVVDHLSNKLALGFEPVGEHQMKNIERPVVVYRVRPDEAAARRPPAKRITRRRQWAAMAVAVLAAGGVLWNLYKRDPAALPPAIPPQPAIMAAAPSIAVLPFANMSGDAALDYFADGVTETMITGLSRSPVIRVVARTSSAAYRGKAIDIRQIGKELGVRYVLEGSVQKGAKKLRIIAQLIDAGTGDHVWGERYDREGDDALALQDEITERIIGSIAGNAGLIRKKEYERIWGKDRANLEEYDYYLRGHQLFDRLTREDTHQAIAVWREGLDHYPDSSLLRIKLGWGYYQLVYGGWSTDPASDLQRAYDFAERGLAGKNLAPIGRFSGHLLKAWLEIYYRNDWDQAWREREVALALNPNDPVVITMMAELAIQAGKADDAIASLNRDISWDSSQFFSSPHFRLGMAYFMKGEYQTALEHLKREPNLEPMYTLTFLAATYAELGQIEQARASVVKMLEANPEISLAVIRTAWPFRHEADSERLIGALRKADLPE